jgi:hypothetical protein
MTICLFSAIAFGQSTAGVTGTVTDANGAAVVGATVKLTDTKTAKEQTTTTNEQGSYAFARLSPGTGFTLTFTAQGFETLVVQNVSLGVSITETHNVQMTVGQVSNTVTVTSTGEATLNTTDATIGNVIEERRLKDLPIQIRNSPASLLGLQPGVVGNNVGAAGANRIGSVTGARADQGNITIDGIDANDQATGQAFATVGNAPIDAIQEFRAVTTNPSASEGRSSGAQIELVTKSGTNQFHGNVREYNRTAATAANSFFNNRAGTRADGTQVSPRPQLTRNQFGGSIGGRIIKDKLFFFFDYEGRRDAQGVSYARIVPLQHLREGRVAYLNNTAGCPTNARLTTRPECITILTTAQVAALDPKGIGANPALVSFLASRYPLPNDLTLGNGINTGGFRFNAPSKRLDNTYTSRYDWNATEKQRVFMRWNIARRVQTDTVNSVAQQFPGDPETAQILVRDYAWVAGHTWVIKDNLINQATVGVSRSGLRFPNNLKTAFPNQFTFGAGLTAPFASISEQDRFVLVPTIRDDVTWTKGKHNLSFGTQIKPIDSKSGLTNDFNNVTVGLGGGLTNFNTSPGLRPSTIGAGATRQASFDSPFAFILGRLASVSTSFNYSKDGTAFAPGTGKHRDFKYNEYEFYGQDNWRVRNDLTLSYGLRWQYYSAPYEKNGFQACNDVDYEQLVSTRLKNAAAGIAGPTAEPILTYNLCGKGNNARPYYQPDRNNFAPRFSLAWNPSFKEGLFGKVLGDRKTVIRGGGSVVYDRVGGAVTFIQDQVSYLFDNSASQSFGGTSANNSLLNNPRFTGLTTLPVSNTAPTISHPFTPFVVNGVPTGLATGGGEFNYAIDQHFRTPYAIQYSVGFQRELPANFILEASYVGRQGRKLFTQADASQALNFKDAASGQLMFSAFNALQAGSVANQPWFENQVGAATLANYGLTCPQAGTAFGFGPVSCTGLVNAIYGGPGGTIENGDTSDTIQDLYFNGLLRPNVGMSAQFGTNIYISNQGASSYNGMLVSLRKRFSKGLQFDLNYTWSHSIDNQSSIANTVAGGLVCDITNLRACRGNSDFDIRHLVNANFIYELPFGRGRMWASGAPGWANQVIGGWEVTGIYAYRSGQAFTTTTGSFPVGFNFNSPAAFNNSGDFGTGIRNATTGSINYFANPLAVFDPSNPTKGILRYPHHGEIGSRNVLRGPSFWNADIAILKNINLPWEGKRVQLRGEMYNVFNHNSFALPASLITSTAFGNITSSSTTAREMQFAIRLEF